VNSHPRRPLGDRYIRPCVVLCQCPEEKCGEGHRDDDSFLKRGSDVPVTGSVTGTVTVVRTVAIVLTVTEWPMPVQRDTTNMKVPYLT
jgi:hypothetical protein